MTRVRTKASRRIVLAYSGNLETTVAIPWLREHLRAEVVTVTLDLGRGRELEDVRDRALRSGAVRAHVLDAREEFARDFLTPAFKANALREDRQPSVAILGRILVARKIAEVAAIEETSSVAHGGSSTGLGSSVFERTLAALAPALTIVVPASGWARNGRGAQLDYLDSRGLPHPIDTAATYRVDTTMWGRSISMIPDDGDAAVGGFTPPQAAYVLTRQRERCPENPAHVDVTFSAGLPIALNGIAMPLIDLSSSMNTIAGIHGVGRHRVSAVSPGPCGTAQDEFSEAPAATVFQTAHRALRARILEAIAEAPLASETAGRYAAIICSGAWFTPEREALDSVARRIADRVNGSVRLTLSRGQCEVLAVEPELTRWPIGLALRPAVSTTSAAAARQGGSAAALGAASNDSAEVKTTE